MGRPSAGRDQYFVLHHISLAVWLGSMVVICLEFLRVAQCAGADSATLSRLTALVVVATLGFGLAGGHHGYVVMQKILACAAVAWLCGVFVTVSVSTVHLISSRQALAESQARRYLKVLVQGHRRPTRHRRTR